MIFRWNEWNLEHVPRHGVSPEMAEHVVLTARRPYPMRREEDKWLVWGEDPAGKRIQVVYVIPDPEEVYIIHARPLTPRENRRHRRRNKR